MAEVFTSFAEVWLISTPVFFMVGFMYDFDHEDIQTSIVNGLIFGLGWPWWVGKIVYDAYQEGRL